MSEPDGFLSEPCASQSIVQFRAESSNKLSRFLKQSVLFHLRVSLAFNFTSKHFPRLL